MHFQGRWNFLAFLFAQFEHCSSVVISLAVDTMDSVFSGLHCDNGWVCVLVSRTPHSASLPHCNHSPATFPILLNLNPDARSKNRTCRLSTVRAKRIGY
jgi:hypothetical protein